MDKRFLRFAMFIVLVLGCGKNADSETKTINGIECVLVKAGTFMMGSPTNESNRQDDETQHKVTITKDFWISKYEVTQAQYKVAMGYNPSNINFGGNYPVNNVDWYEAVAFCDAVGGHLPTEAQWEFAARGGNNSKGYIYSGSNDINAVAWYNGNFGSKTQPVGTKAPNELGIYDMSGNVWEWCSDWYGGYPSGSVVYPAGPVTGSDHVYRGGSLGSVAWGCRVAIRFSHSPSGSYGDLGFRVVFDNDAAGQKPSSVAQTQTNKKAPKGYADLDFGMSPEQVKQKGYAIKYPSETDGLKHYQDNNVSDPVTERFFSFFDNKLMFVTLTYDISKAGVDEAVTESLIEKYNIYGKIEQASENTYYAVISDDLQIEMIYDLDKRDLYVLFRGLKIQALFEESQKKKYQKNLGF